MKKKDGICKFISQIRKGLAENSMNIKKGFWGNRKEYLIPTHELIKYVDEIINLKLFPYQFKIRLKY
jgi:hypothetical protein